MRVRPSPHAFTTNHGVWSESSAIPRIVCLCPCIGVGVHGPIGIASQKTKQQAVSCTSGMSQTVTSINRACHDQQHLARRVLLCMRTQVRLRGCGVAQCHGSRCHAPLSCYVCNHVETGSKSVSSECLCAILVCTLRSKSPWHACMAGARYRAGIVHASLAGSKCSSLG